MTLTGGHWWQFFRKVGPVSVVHVDLSANRTAEALIWLDQAEMARYNRYSHERPKREFVMCRAALRAILCEQLGCANHQLSFDITERGKPFALVERAIGPINFNVSHSGRHGLIAWTSQGRVGVDVEERSTRHDLSGVLQKVFAPAEQAELVQFQGERKRHLFFALWTMKEALVKALGVGIAQGFSLFELPSAMYKKGQVAGSFHFPHLDEVLSEPPIQWWLQNLSHTQFAAALAYELQTG